MKAYRGNGVNITSRPFYPLPEGTPVSIEYESVWTQGRSAPFWSRENLFFLPAFEIHTLQPIKIENFFKGLSGTVHECSCSYAQGRPKTGAALGRLSVQRPFKPMFCKHFSATDGAGESLRARVEIEDNFRRNMFTCPWGFEQHIRSRSLPSSLVIMQPIIITLCIVITESAMKAIWKKTNNLRSF